MAPTLVRRPEGYGKPFLMRASPTGAAQDGDSPRVVLGRWWCPEGSVRRWPVCSDLRQRRELMMGVLR
jgi:hypothetical protein